MNLIKPITPQEVANGSICHLPDEVINCFNELISRNYSGGSSEVLQDDVVTLILARLTVERQSIFDNHWLDVELFYENAGWNVQYDYKEEIISKDNNRPVGHATGRAYFRFTVKKKAWWSYLEKIKKLGG